MQPAIAVEDLHKHFRVKERAPGLRGAVRGLASSRTREVSAVEGLSFAVAPGERVAFLGPNGAGKSTTIKILSGILHPDRGRVRVLGFEPWRDRHALGFRIGAVFGQRSQLWYHLPAADTFELLGRVYEQEPALHRRRQRELVERFELGGLLAKPVRQLSLGERMRCEIVASLLHAPEILFLDEPTIGLDVTAKAVLRDLIRAQSEHEGRTLLFTSHDTGDMERVCDRVIVIHQGRLLLDRSTASLRGAFIARKRVTVHSAAERIDVDLPGVAVTRREPHATVLSVDLRQTPVERVVQALLAQTALEDLSIEDPPMDEIVQAIYASAVLGPAVGADEDNPSPGPEGLGPKGVTPWPSH
jgi:ABC-2 type transport system ATP-binding protein